MEQVLREWDLWKKKKYMTSKKEEIAPQTGSKLSEKIADYCEKGPFILHQPQFMATCNFVMKHYQDKLPTIGWENKDLDEITLYP